MSKINKIITNKPVTLTQEEVANLSETLSAVRTAGGGGGGATYGGDGRYIEITGNNTITLTTTAANQLDRVIPTKVSDLTDSANYATVESLTAYQAAGDYLSANALDSLSGTWETVTDKLDTTAFSTVSGNFLTAHQSLTDYYTKLQTSGASELNTAFGNKQDNLTQEQLSAISSVSSIKGTILTGDSNIRATSAADGNNIKWTLELTAQPVVTDTTLSGYDGIVATKDSTINTQWNIGIAQAYKEQIEEVSSKLTKTEADTYYAPISVTGDVDTLKSSSGDWNKVSAKLDTSAFSSVSGKFISASQPFTANLGGGWSQSYLTIIDTTAVFNGYGSNSFSSISNNLIQGMSNSYTGGDNFAQGTSNTAAGTSFAQGVTNYAKETSIAQGSVNTAINCSQAFGVGNSITDTGMAIGKYNKTSSDASFVIGNGTNSNRSDLFIIKHDGTVSSTGDFIVDGKSLSSVYNTVSTNSGDWLKESDLNYYVTSSDITTQDTDYVMTTTGWKVLTLPGGGMTQVIHDETLTGQGNDNNSKLGVAWSALSGNVSSKLDTTAAAQTYLDKTTYATDSATFVTSSSDTITGTKQYALTTAGWAEVSTPTIPDITANNGLSANGHTIGIDNTNLVADTQYAWTTTGWDEVDAPTILDAGSGIEVVSDKINVLLGTDLAFNTTTSAIQINTDGTAYGTHAFVEGTNTTASGNGAHAEGADAGAFGQGAHAGGYGTHTTGVGNFIHGTFLNFASPDGTSVSNTPVFVGGTLNATTAQDYNDHGGYLQIMGNGAYTGGGQGNNSDAYILYRDGTVKAKTFIAGGDTLSANYPVPKSVPNTADNTMQVQKMFVCTSDADIVAHAALANGEGCIFFRVG